MAERDDTSERSAKVGHGQIPQRPLIVISITYAVKQATWTHAKEGGKSAEKQEVAIKCIEKRLVKANPQIVLDEMEVLRGLDNEHIVKILDWFESKDKYYLVFEHIEGGELFEQIVKRHHFTEHDAAICIYAILQGVQYLHHKDIAHRDLKPENLLLRDESDLSDLVIADFGVAKHLEEDNEMMKTLVGSPGYSAPELFDKKGYKGPPADIWSIGVIAYALLSGKSPFSQRDADACLEQQRRGEVEFAHSIWDSISEEAKDFIRQCLRVDADKRPTADGLIEHAWMQQEGVRSKENIAPEVKRTL